ncbi:MAG: PHP domain-containing protein [Gemmatimonadetes bacterium]|nr:PHP domain-containing protein [Gemmatimonadota bacterium]
MRLDLHVHSTASDGSCTPSEVVARAVAGGLDVIALTDHDTAGGVAEAVEAARESALEVIPAAELSSSTPLGEIHILGYFLDPESEAMTEHRVRSRARREGRMRGMLERLTLQGVRVSYSQVVAQLGGKDVAPARPHLARALVASGCVSSVPDAFARLIGDSSPAFLPTDIGTPTEAMETIRRAGGLPVWAHPDGRHLDLYLDAFVEEGLQGLEVYRPGTPQNRVDRLEALARGRNLLVTGGSDWHGPEQKRDLGDFFVESTEVEAFLCAGGL